MLNGDGLGKEIINSPGFQKCVSPLWRRVFGAEAITLSDARVSPWLFLFGKSNTINFPLLLLLSLFYDAPLK